MGSKHEHEGGAMERIERFRSFGGVQEVWRHRSATLGGDARFAIYLPPQAHERPCPVVYWLSGLTCTEQNFITKAGAQRDAAALGLIVVAPDTSPRGPEVADDDAYDLGQGAGFYLDAEREPWRAHYRMYSYVTQELPALVETHFPASQGRAIMGHSMGGHGALVIGLKNPGRYASVSAFAPIVAPSELPWGQKAFAAYLGEDQARWRDWDACALLERRGRGEGPAYAELLVDQGSDDPFLESQLQPERLREACGAAGQPLRLRVQPGYDHSYYFIASFVGEHLEFHARHLSGK